MLSENISRNSGGVLCFAGQNAVKLAEKYGTPLYLMDEGRIRANCRMYLHAFRDASESTARCFTRARRRPSSAYMR